MLGDQTTSHDLIELGGGGISQVGTGSYKLSLRRKNPFLSLCRNLVIQGVPP